MRNNRVKDTQSEEIKDSNSSRNNSDFGNHSKSPQVDSSKLDIKFNITIPKLDADQGTKKKLSYSIGEDQENILVSIPPGTTSGCKLRIKDKGRKNSNKRGDLIITVDHHVEA